MLCCGGDTQTSVDSSDERWLDCVEETSNNSQWMTNLPKELTMLPITRLAIPGSHDSGAYYLDPKSPICPDESSVIKWAGKYGWGKKIIIRWSITQKSTITQQLNAGIRYFDMRIGYLDDRKDFFFVHGCYGYPISNLLEEMQHFLKSHPKEVLIVDFNHFYSFSDAIHDEFSALVLKYFKSLLYPCDKATSLEVSLNDMWESEKQIIARYTSSYVCDKECQFWSEKFIDTPWFNTDDIDKLITCLDGRFDTLTKGVLNIYQAILTPQTSTIIFHVTSSLEKHLAVPGNARVKTWLESVYNQKKMGVNIVICDFELLCGMVPYVLKLNDLLLTKVKGEK
ncbi:PI-PLC X domain-containing protein 2-like [Clytia hemisphaerica]|uniref:Uncharacterized protein n=1 Tax=Clytia hemisphaerica TaxID=252671 RepID=A0A7M5WJP1_9CNID